MTDQVSIQKEVTDQAGASVPGFGSKSDPASGHVRFSDRFLAVRPHPIWEAVRPEDWSSWIWQQQNRIRTLEEINAVLSLTESEIQAFRACDDRFHVAITPYYASLIWGRMVRRVQAGESLADVLRSPDPIRIQAIPQSGELAPLPEELEDPLAEEAHMPVPGITHRYPDRVLFYTTHHCPVYCRHCTRKRKVSDPTSAASLDQIRAGLAYIAAHPEVRDVLVSGGDPLSNSDERLELILRGLRAIPHVEIVRIGTRNLVTLPQRVTPKLGQMLSKFHPIFVHTHFNHPDEVTAEARAAAAVLADAGCVVNNQMVLLRDVNDSVEVVRELNHRLLMSRIQPYYMLSCDMAQGLGHFRVPLERGLEILRGLRGWTSGLAVPAYVVDLPGGGGKVQLVPESLLGIEDQGEIRRYRFRNYQGREVVLTERTAAAPFASGSKLDL